MFPVVSASHPRERGGAPISYRRCSCLADLVIDIATSGLVSLNSRNLPLDKEQRSDRKRPELTHSSFSNVPADHAKIVNHKIDFCQKEKLEFGLDQGTGKQARRCSL